MQGRAYESKEVEGKQEAFIVICQANEQSLHTVDSALQTIVAMTGSVCFLAHGRKCMEACLSCNSIAECTRFLKWQAAFSMANGLTHMLDSKSGDVLVVKGWEGRR